MLPVPTGYADITADWVLNLVCHLHQIPSPKDLRVVSLSIKCQPNNEGVLSDITKVSVHVQVGKKSTEIVHNLFIKIIPHHYRKLVITHRLFDREIMYYSQVLPTLINFMKVSNPNMKLKHFTVPKFVYGDVTQNGEGVLVLEDLSAKGYNTFDATMMLLDYQHFFVTILALSEFHALAIAFDLAASPGRKLIDLFPLLDPAHLMWLQDDMVNFLKGVSDTADQFLRSLKGEEEVARVFGATMRDPRPLFNHEVKRQSQFQCLQHGDSWHNNFLFRKTRKDLRVSVIDWQVSYCGHAPTDLCYLIYSSSTQLFRVKYLDSLLHCYYDNLLETIAMLGVPAEAFNPTFDEFFIEFVKSIPFCLLFCANSEDLTSGTNSNTAKQGQQAPQSRKVSVADDRHMGSFDEDYNTSRLSLVGDKRLARSIRRRNFLDICKEAIQLGALH